MNYLLGGAPSEMERLQLQSRVWEPAGRAFLSRIPAGKTAIDVGCGVMGWLRVLAEWVGVNGWVTGSDIDEKMLTLAAQFVADTQLPNVRISRDDIFDSHLPAANYDLVHSRFQLAPLGREKEQVKLFRKLVKPGGWIVLEEPDISSWRVNPEAPATARLIALIEQGFKGGGGDFNAGRRLPALLAPLGQKLITDAVVISLPHGHPYLRLPVLFANSLRPRFKSLLDPAELEALIQESERELGDAERWGTTFTLVQAAVQVD